jgi:hypothetical protein
LLGATNYNIGAEQSMKGNQVGKDMMSGKLINVANNAYAYPLLIKHLLHAPIGRSFIAIKSARLIGCYANALAV